MNWKNMKNRRVPVMFFVLAAFLLRFLVTYLGFALPLSEEMTRLFYQGGTLVAMAVLLAGIIYGWKTSIMGRLFHQKSTNIKNKDGYYQVCPYCGANVPGKDRNCVVCGKDMYAEEREEIR